MCGIAGFISLDNTLDAEKLKKATALLRHRGPDGEGFYFSPDKKIGIAHRRLSVLDLSSVANQPMFSSDGRYCIIFNGEVYNFKELQKELPDKGALLKTSSDTEVILELFAQQGPACFSKLEGMFALAIYDIQKNELTLCRDHAGVKPLFYYQDEENFIFASELKAIKSILGDKLTINKAAIPSFFHLGFIPQPETIYNKTYKFPSAHFLQINTASRFSPGISNQVKPFWKLEENIHPSVSKDEKISKKQLKDLLLNVVEKNLVSDVPVGVLLSGGVDSGLVTALATKANGGNNKIKTFSIAIDDEKYDESKHARAIADLLQTDHHEFRFKETDMLELVDKMFTAYDEPLADSSIFPTMLLSKLAREYVTVVLSGDGGDELFHGYGAYTWANRLSNPLLALARRPLFGISKLLGSRYRRAGNMFNYSDKERMPSHIFSQEQYFFSEKEMVSLLIQPPAEFYSINDFPEKIKKLSAVEKQSLWDFDNYLKDDLLVKVDRASMQYSLETRVPLLDRRLIEFAYNLDSDLKIKNGTMKYLLKEVLYDYVPREMFDRPKWGFGIPLVKWLKTDLKYLLDKYTSIEIIEKHKVVHYDVVRKIKSQYHNGQNYLSNRLWLVVVLHWWLEEYS